MGNGEQVLLVAVARMRRPPAPSSMASFSESAPSSSRATMRKGLKRSAA